MGPSWRRAWIPAGRLLARYLLPTACFGCGRLLQLEQHLGACARCWGSIVPAPPFPPAPRIRPLAGADAAVLYRGFARRVLLRAKMRRRRELLAPLAAQLAAAVGAWSPLDPGALVVPVPSHPWARLTRGFDPARDLAVQVARSVDLPCVPGALRRRWSASASLKRLGAADRRSAAARAFYCPRPAVVAGRTILLVDDVWTTGATARACARELAAARAGPVTVWVWARTPGRDCGAPRSASV